MTQEAVLARLRALVRSGRSAPLKPLAAASTLPHRDAFASAGSVLLRAVESLLPAAVPTALMASTPGLVEAMQAELARGPVLGFTRLDVVCPPDAPEQFQVLEVQAGDPSGMGYHDTFAELFGEPPTLLPSHRRTLEALTAGRRIAVVVEEQAVLKTDSLLMTEYYERNGWQALCVDARELRFEGGALRARGQAVDAVYRDALDDLFAGDFAAGGAALLAAVRAGAVVVMNPFAAGLGDDKALLEPLSTPSAWTGETAAVLRAHVPCTRVVSERRVDWEGRAVDLPVFLRAHPDEVVLKPVDGYGGAGVTIGRFATTAAWEEAVEGALRQPGRFVAQRYQPHPRQPVLLLEGPPGDAFVVHSLWFHRSSLVGAYSRASSNPVVNVHLGGGMAPVFFRPPFS